MHPELNALREMLVDDIDRPLELVVHGPLQPASRRLMASLGVRVEERPRLSATAPVMTEQERANAAFDHRESLARVVRRQDAGETVETCAECCTELDVATPAHAPRCSRWGTRTPATSPEPVAELHVVPEPDEPLVETSQEYEASAARARERAEADDYSLEICAWCHCEVDVDEPAHRPGCEGIGKPRVGEISALAIEAMDRQLDALEALDAGTPQRELVAATSRSSTRTDEALKDRPAEADEPTTTTSGLHVHGADGAETGDSPRDGRVGGAIKTRRPIVHWTRETALDAIRAAAEELGHPPSHLDYLERLDIPMPSGPTAKKLFGSWADMIEAAGFARPTRGTNYRRHSSEGRQDRREHPRSDAAATSRDLPPDPEVTVDDVGLQYATVDEALAAADEIERNAERVAADARESGATEAADRLVAEASELAERVRAAARASQDSSGPSRAVAVGAPASLPDEQQPEVRPAATADGSGAGGTDMPPADPEVALIREVLDELAAARAAWPAYASAHEGHSIIREELDELWHHVRGRTGSSTNARREAIQIAATAMRYALEICEAAA